MKTVKTNPVISPARRRGRSRKLGNSPGVPDGVAVAITAVAAIAPPYYNSYGDGNAKVINNCYTDGWCAWDAVDRGSNQLNETHYNSRSFGYQV